VGKLEEAAALKEKEFADVCKIAKNTFIYLETLLFRLEAKEAGRRPSKAHTDRFQTSVANLFERKGASIRTALQTKNREAAKKLFIDVALKSVEPMRESV